MLALQFSAVTFVKLRSLKVLISTPCLSNTTCNLASQPRALQLQRLRSGSFNMIWEPWSLCLQPMYPNFGASLIDLRVSATFSVPCTCGQTYMSMSFIASTILVKGVDPKRQVAQQVSRCSGVRCCRVLQGLRSPALYRGIV